MEAPNLGPCEYQERLCCRVMGVVLLLRTFLPTTPTPSEDWIIDKAELTFSWVC